MTDLAHCPNCQSMICEDESTWSCAECKKEICFSCGVENEDEELICKECSNL